MSDKIITMYKQGSSDKTTSDVFQEGDSMDRFVLLFEASARRCELIV